MSKISKDPRDILRDISAEISGISPESVTFSNFREKKHKKRYKDKKTIESESDTTKIQNKEGFGITDISVKFCGYDDIPKKQQLRKKGSLEEWGAFDFFVFAQKKYVDRYGEAWDLNIGGGSLTINKIRDKFYDLFGFCCNLIMRDYIDFFFVNYMDHYVKQDGFYFSQMLSDKIMCEFYDGYNFPVRFEEYIMGEKHKKDSCCISKREIRDAFMIGDTSLVGNYGVVISLNWLLMVKKMSPKEATRLVISACKDMYGRGMIEVVRKSTELYSPYPSNLAFISPQALIDKIDSNIKLEIEFNDDNNEFEFLQKKKR